MTYKENVAAFRCSPSRWEVEVEVEYPLPTTQ